MEQITSEKLDFNLYQQKAKETAFYPVLGHPIVYPALGLAGEAGEVAEKIKKMCRDNNCVLTDDIKKLIALELSDVLWYISAIASELEYNLETIASMNIEKLNSRKIRGVLNGSGDYR